MRSRIIGWRSNGAPIFALHGSTGPISLFIGDDDDDDSDDSNEDDDDDEDNDDDDDGQEEREDWRPPTQAEWVRLQDKVKKVTRESVERKNLLRENGIPLKPGKTTTQNGGTEEPGSRAALLAEAKAQARAEGAQNKALARLAALDRLRDSGWNGKGKSQIGKLIDIDRLDIEVGPDGELTIEGLDEQIEEIRTELPEWFRRRRAEVTRDRTGAASVDGQRKPAPPKPSKGWRREVSDRFDGIGR